MGVGIGGLITNLMQGDPSQQIGQALAGPNPNPQPPAAGVPSPTGAPGPAGAPPGVNPSPSAPPLPPAQAYAPDPANASTIALLLKVHQQDLASNDINRNIQLMSSGFGTAQQQHDKMALVNSAGEGGGDTLQALGQITKLQGEQMELQQKQRFQASADLLAQTVGGFKPGQGALMSSDPELFNTIIARKVADQSPTELGKNINAYVTQARAANIPESQIQSNVQMAYVGGMGGSQDAASQDMMRDRASFLQANPNQPVPSYLTNIEEYKGHIATTLQKGKDVQADQANFSTAKNAYDRMIGDTKGLLAHPGLDTILGPGNATLTGKVAQETGGTRLLPNQTQDALAKYNQVMAQQYGAGVQDFKGAGRITNQELATDMPSQSTMGERGVTPESFRQNSQDYLDKLSMKRAQLFGQAGQLASPDLSDADYEKVNPIYKPGGSQYVAGQPAGPRPAAAAAPAAAP